MSESESKWTLEEERLIQFVEKNPCLYNTCNFSVSANDRQAVTRLWEVIAGEIGWSAKKCEVKWDSIKQNYNERKSKKCITKYSDGRLYFLNTEIYRAILPVNRTDIIPAENPSTSTNKTKPGTKPIIVNQAMIRALLESKTDQNEDESLDKVIQESVASMFATRPLESSMFVTNDISNYSNVNAQFSQSSSYAEGFQSNRGEFEEGNYMTKPMDAYETRQHIKTVFKELAEYTTANLSNEQQKELRYKIFSFVNQEKSDNNL